MTENQLYAYIIAAMNAGLAALGITGVTVKQRYQPTTQGTPIGPTIFLHNDGDQLYGYPGKTDNFDSVSGSFNHYENQTYITTFQISALAINDPSNVDAMTVGDLIKAAAFCLNSDATRLSLRSNGIAVERITKIRKVHFKDDKDRFEEDPSFDCSFVYCQVNESQNPATDKVTVTLYPVLP